MSNTCVFQFSPKPKDSRDKNTEMWRKTEHEGRDLSEEAASLVTSGPTDLRN